MVVTKVVNSVLVGILFFQLEWNGMFQSVSACRFGVILFIYIYKILKKKQSSVRGVVIPENDLKDWVTGFQPIY